MNVIPHLNHFVTEHLRVHGCDWRSRSYIEQNIELWASEYGTLAAAQVREYMYKEWGKKGEKK